MSPFVITYCPLVGLIFLRVRRGCFGAVGHRDGREFFAELWLLSKVPAVVLILISEGAFVREDLPSCGAPLP